MEIQTETDLVQALYVRAQALQHLAQLVARAMECRPGWEARAADRLPLLLAAEAQFLEEISGRVSRLAGVSVEAVTVQVDPEGLQAANGDLFRDHES
jgi:hypothetical protein